MQRPAGQQPIPLQAKRVFQGVLFDVYQWEQTLFDGSTATFEKLKREDTTVVLAVTNDQKILVLTQDQPGTETKLVLPGGRVESGEEPEKAAVRELLEETGYQAGELILYQATQPVGKLDWVVYLFIARGCRRVQDQNLEAGERIAVQEVSFAELVELAANRKLPHDLLTYEVLQAKLQPNGLAELKAKITG